MPSVTEGDDTPDRQSESCPVRTQRVRKTSLPLKVTAGWGAAGGQPCGCGRCPPPPHWEPALPPRSSRAEKRGPQTCPHIKGGWKSASSGFLSSEVGERLFEARMSQRHSEPPVPAEPSPHLCEQPADLTLAEQVGAAARERGVHGSSVRLDDLHTHETHVSQLPRPGKRALRSPMG